MTDIQVIIKPLLLCPFNYIFELLKIFLIVEFVPVYKNSQRISVSGSNLGSSVFEIANFHFHWGRSIGRGKVINLIIY